MVETGGFQPMGRPILADMNWKWSFRELPVRPRQLMALAFLFLLSFWAQSGFDIDRNHLLFFISNYSIWILLLPFISELSKLVRRPIRVSPLIFPIIILIVIHWITSNFVLYSLRFLSGDTVLPDVPEILSFLIPSLASRIIDLALFTGLLSWFNQQQTLAQQKIIMAESQALLEKSKLQSLKNQLNPHFLFNALHSVNTLITTDAQKASDMIIKISGLLRSMLAMNERHEHTLQEEVDFVNQYLEIEAERFKDRLLIEIDVETSVRSFVIPTMTLQPLVENAFKHGISKLPGNSTLRIHVNREDNLLKLLVSNDLPENGISIQKQGIGLENLESRLNSYFQQRAELKTAIRDQRFEALITITL